MQLPGTCLISLITWHAWYLTLIIITIQEWWPDILVISWLIPVQTTLMIHYLLMIHLTWSCSFPYADNYLINYKKDNLYWEGETDGLQVVNMFTVLLGMLCNSNFRFYLRASRCSEGSADSQPPVTFLNGHNIRPTSCLSSGTFQVSSGTSWAVVPGMYRIHYKHNPLFHHQFSITTLACSYIDVCMLGR